MILGPDGYWRAMEIHDGQMCVRVVGRGDELLPEVDLDFDEPTRIVRILKAPKMEEVALADMARNQR